MTNSKVDLEKLAASLGYESIAWDSENDCYSGYGSSNDFDRSKDSTGGVFVASDDRELERLTKTTH